jgi:DNA-directed RNA polymerase subunit RPC12/RpoP
VLTENNYKELAFTYMNWKKGGYKECKSCGRLFKTKKEGNQIYCKKCSPKVQSLEIKTIVCVDCGETVVISSKNNKTCRCDYCQKELDKENTKKRVQKHRDTQKM